MQQEAAPWDSTTFSLSAVAAADFRSPDVVRLIDKRTEAILSTVTLRGENVKTWRHRVYEKGSLILLSEVGIINGNTVVLVDGAKAIVIPLAIWADPALGVGYEL